MKKILNFLFLPRLSEYETVGVIVISITGVLISLILGINQETLISIAVWIVIAIVILLFRLRSIYKQTGKEMFKRQKIFDRCIVIFITGFSSITVLQNIVDGSQGRALEFNNIDVLLVAFVGMRAFAGVSLIPLYLDYENKLQKGILLNKPGDNLWVSLLDENYENRQVSKRGFTTSVLIAICTTLIAIAAYDNLAQQILLSYAIFTLLPSPDSWFNHKPKEAKEDSPLTG